MSNFGETTTANPPVSDMDVRTIEATVLLMWSSPILLESLETILKDDLGAYPHEERVADASSSPGPSPLLSWLRSFRDLFEIRSARGPDNSIVKVCGIAGMDDEYWEGGPESPRREDLFDIPELSSRATTDGRVESIEDDGLHRNIQVYNAAGVCREHIVPIIFHLSVHEGANVKKGDPLFSNSVMLPNPSVSEDESNRFRYVDFTRRVVNHPDEGEYEDRPIGANVGKIIGDYLQHVDTSGSDSENLEDKRRRVLDTLTKGERIKGKVKTIAYFGVFVDINGLDGLIHISNLSWSYVRHPRDIVRIGQELEVVVLDIDREKKHVSLGLKQLQKNPWDTIETRHPVHSVLRGKVVSLVPYGAFVEIEPGINGFVHTSEFSWTRQVANASDMLKVGDEVTAVVISIDKANRKIDLSIKLDDPEAERLAILTVWQKLNKAGWKYSLRDIVRFHTSVKTGALTILSGASGVGKSSLFKHYARFATACETDGELWKRMNVVSTWMDPSDLLGWKNSLANSGSDFQYAPGGLQDFLEGLQKVERSGRLSLLCFEEMNLAQAELYFSDFLQAISDPSEERKISNPRGSVFKIPNLRIVGTCNIDHTTKPFTERFLDRCNYIDLSVPDCETAVDQFFPEQCPDDNPSFPKNGIPPFQQKMISAIGINAAINQRAQNDRDWAENWKKFVELLKKLNVFPNHRVRVSMAEYVLARPALLDLEDATLGDEKYYANLADNFLLGLDEVLAQRVLPKLLLRGEWDKNDDFWPHVNSLKSLCERNKLNLTLSREFLDNHLNKGSMG